MEFSAFEKSLIRLMKSAIKIPKTISEVEMLICSKLVLSKLKMDDGKKPVSIADVQLFLKEIGVFSENEDMALHAYSPQGTLDNLELISWIGDEIIGESSIHAENLLDGKSKDVGFSSRGLLEIKAKTIGKTAADATFFRQDPFIKLRTSVDRPVFAIDSEYAHEIDDAVSIENDWIHVHIADPTSYIPHHHPLSQLAQLRANSVYLPHRHFPLMPNILSDDLFNLGVSNFALTFSAKLNDGGDIVDYKVEPSYLNNVKRLTYTNVDTVLDWTRIIPGTPWWAQGQIHKANTPTTGGISTSEAEILKKIQDTTWKHRQRRLERNAIIQDQFANNVRVLEAPVPVSPLNPSHSFSSNVFTQQTTIEIDHNSIPERSPSSILVQEAMIIAGRVAAKFCHDRKLNVAYRCQNSPIVTVEGRNAYDLALSNRHGTSGILPLEHIQPLFPYMESAYMSNTPNAHSSLGLLGVSNENQFPGYLKVTSPLRRYQDMVVHYQIGNFLLGKKPAFTELEVRDITTYTENLTKRGNSLSKRSVRYWVLEYLRRSKNEQDCIEKIYDGVVMYRPQSAENKFHVSIPELAGLAAQCISTTPYVAGQRITIRIEKADPLSGQAIFKAI